MSVSDYNLKHFTFFLENCLFTFGGGTVASFGINTEAYLPSDELNFNSSWIVCSSAGRNSVLNNDDLSS